MVCPYLFIGPNCLVSDRINPFLLGILEVAEKQKHLTLVSVLENVLKCSTLSYQFHLTW